MMRLVQRQKKFSITIILVSVSVFASKPVSSEGSNWLANFQISNPDTTTTITGTVTDSLTGDPLQAVNVHLIDNDLGPTEYGAYSNNNGVYWISGIPSGTYYLAFTMVGYRTCETDTFTVMRGSQIRRDIRLVPGMRARPDLLDIAWPKLFHEYEVSSTYTNISPKTLDALIALERIEPEAIPPLILPTSVPVQWAFDCKVIDWNGVPIDSGSVTWTFSVARQFNLEEIEDAYRLVKDKKITAGPLRVQIRDIYSHQNKDFILFETPDGLYRADRWSADKYWIRLWLPRNPRVEDYYSEGIDSGHQVWSIDTVQLNEAECDIIEMRWYHVGYPGVYQYRWAIGVGLLELLETKTVIESGLQLLSSDLILYRLRSIDSSGDGG